MADTEKTQAASCHYAGQEYSTGALVCQSGWIMRCNDGRWDNTGERCKESTAPLTAVEENPQATSCFYAGQEYSDGAQICQAGWVMRCNNGQWQNTGQRCRQPPASGA